MFWYFLRILFSSYQLFFFRRAQGKNLNYLRVKNPVLIALNHPNAFMDAIGLSLTLYYPRTYYMARGDAFKEGFITTVLTATGIVPIFRMRDAGLEGVRKNNASFSIVYKLWNKNKKIIVFPEGLCIQERRLRPIQKGTARMAFGFMDQYKRDDLLIIPVNVTYSHPSKFRTDVYYEAGEPIAVKEYYNLYLENQVKAVNTLTKALESKMQQLVPTLNNKGNDQLLEQLQEIYKHQFLEENKLDDSKLENHQNFWKHTIDLLNKADKTNPEALAELRDITGTYIQELRLNGVTDQNVAEASKGRNTFILSLFFVIAGFPFYLTGKLLSFLPWFAAKSIAKKTARNIEFYTSVNFVTGTFFALFYLIIELLVLWIVFDNWLILPGYFMLKFVLGQIALAYSDQVRYRLGDIRMRSLRKKEPYRSLSQKRHTILRILTGN